MGPRWDHPRGSGCHPQSHGGSSVRTGQSPHGRVVRTQKGINCQDLCSHLPFFSQLILNKVKKIKPVLDQPAVTLTLLTLKHIPCIPTYPTSLHVVCTLIRMLQFDRGWRKHYEKVDFPAGIHHSSSSKKSTRRYWHSSDVTCRMIVVYT